MNIKEIIIKSFAVEFWKMCDNIDSMPENNIDAVCKKADAVATMQAKFKRLPLWLQDGIGNSKRSEVM